jgi:hypothetical protein
MAKEGRTVTRGGAAGIRLCVARRGDPEERLRALAATQLRDAPARGRVRHPDRGRCNDRRPTRPLQATATAVLSSWVLRSRMRLPRLSGKTLAADSRGDSTGRMAENCGSRLKFTRGRVPSTQKPAVEQLVGGWSMVPHGDRHDRTQSRCVKYQKLVLARLEDHIVCVLILRDRFERYSPRCARTRPVQRLLQSF